MFRKLKFERVKDSKISCEVLFIQPTLWGSRELGDRYLQGKSHFTYLGSVWHTAFTSPNV